METLTDFRMKLMEQYQISQASYYNKLNELKELGYNIESFQKGGVKGYSPYQKALITAFIAYCGRVIEKALEIFPEHKRSSNEELLNALVSQGLAEDIAWKILAFTPLAFCRVMLRSSGIKFSEMYRHLNNLNVEE